MSASTIARWNAVPMTRSEPSVGSPNFKRPRDDDDDDDDDVSLVSRTPSPALDDMDVDQDISKYDEYLRAPTREVVTVETKIQPTNKGFALLSKLGWSEGQPLGISGDGRVDPIPFQMKSDSTGIGKASQDVRMIASTVSQRRELDSERQQKETDEQRQAREDAVARKTALACEISGTLKAFYCTLCDKQFQNVAQYDEHTNSYAHHHKARFKDMQASVRMKPQEEIDKRKEKERKREEKELRKIAAASGIKMAKQPSNAVPATISSSHVTSNESALTPEKSGSGGGWAPVSTASSGFKKSGWAAVGSSKVSSIAVVPPTPSEPPPPPPLHSPITQSGFRTAGWTSLDTSQNTTTPSVDASHPPPPPSKLSLLPPPPPVASHDNPPPSKSLSSRIGWQQFQRNNGRRR
ncbi:hypothetical protein L218DRAFT_952574 [Marasmius fiardii PR-910]|nr:hypothetical protein L218DRAFT_952574 [Marasmius fiardii PR-910]